MGITRIRHVKLPVTDLAASTAFYRDLMDLEPWMEFAEGGGVLGASLRHPTAGFQVALRVREHCAGKPELAGFDPVAFEVDAREDLVALAARAERIGARHTGVRDLGDMGSSVDVIDPDGVPVRFLWHGPAVPTAFIGTEIADGKPTGFYDTPRLVLP